MSDDKIRFYGLSTCMWCKKTKKLLEGLGAELDITWVNELEEVELESVRAAVGVINPNYSYPTVDFGEGLHVIGYKPSELEEAFKKWQARMK